MKTLVWLYLAFCVLLGVLFVTAAHCQTTILMPAPKIQFFDVNGKPLAGGQVFTYIAGTSIQQATFTDSTGATQNTDPIILDSGGFPSSPIGPGQSAGIYFTNGASYRICVFSSLSVQQYCVDNVRLVSSNSLSGAANTQVLYDCAGLICGNIGMTFNAGTQTLSVTGLVVSSGGSLNGTFAGNPTFSGTVTFSGSLVVSGNITAGSFTSSCVNAASAGAVRLCKTDAVNWRNNANSADQGFSVDASDRLLISHAGGAVLTGALPFLKFGGTTASFPQWKQVTTELQARLADDSASAPISGSTVTFNGPVGTGVTVSGACAAGQVLTAASTTSVTCAALGATVLVHSLTTNTGTAIGNANTTWITKVVTMPASGCPCRAFVAFGAYFSATNSGTATFWAEDGTSSFATCRTLTNTAGGNAPGCDGASFSPNTYSNNQAVTFVGRGNDDATGGITMTTPPFGSTQGAWLNVDVFASN